MAAPLALLIIVAGALAAETLSTHRIAAGMQPDTSKIGLVAFALRTSALLPRLLNVSGSHCCEYMQSSSMCELSSMPLDAPHQLWARPDRRGRAAEVRMRNVYLPGRHFACILCLHAADRADNASSWDVKLQFVFPRGKTHLSSAHNSSRRRRGSSNCSEDETTNPNGSCSPVGCTIKYWGQRNFFDPVTRLCAPFVACTTAGYQLDLITNQCKLIVYTVPPVNLTTLSQYKVVENFIPASLTCQCNHGTRLVNYSGCECVCDADWTSDTANPDSFVWCNRSRASTYTPMGGGSFQLSSSGKVVLGLLCTGFALLLLCCCYCCRHNIQTCLQKRAEGKAIKNTDTIIVSQPTKDPACIETDLGSWLRGEEAACAPPGHISLVEDECIFDDSEQGLQWLMGEGIDESFGEGQEDFNSSVI